jgi:hypothetical protein
MLDVKIFLRLVCWTSNVSGSLCEALVLPNPVLHNRNSDELI